MQIVQKHYIFKKDFVFIVKEIINNPCESSFSTTAGAASLDLKFCNSGMNGGSERT